MARIIQLSDLIANQIAAGEVVERPQSVIKELIENSIDAHATQIEIELSGVGANRLCIRDNGDGIEKEDLPLVFLRHATSKIRCSEDLFGIQSLGFRGEALASIASVAKCSLKSNGWEIQASPNGLSEIKPAALSMGTQIEVLDLFYNTPVRRKFLKSEKTESLVIEETIKKFVLANPDIEFTIKQDDKPVKHYPRCKNVSTWLSKVTGLAFVEAAIPLDVQGMGLSLRGWIAKPNFGKRQSNLQYFFVNSRIIKDKAINHAIKTGYLEHSQWVEGTYPAYVLYLSLPHQEVDVNVHPTKQEVRFTQSRHVYDFVSSCARKVLNGVTAPRPRAPKLLPSKRFGVTREVSPESKIKSVQKRERFFLYEQDNDVIIVDLWQAQRYLIASYFKNQNNIAIKMLLFPQVIALKTLPLAFTYLAEFGFRWVREENSIRIYQQPRILATRLSIEDLENITSREQIIERLERSEGDFSYLTKQELINLMKDVPSMLKFKLSHEDMQKLMAEQILEI